LKEYDAGTIRNIAFIGHGGSGKTSLSEILLFTAGEINRIGSISEGNTISDYTPNEIEKQISISSSLLHLEWNNTKINILDTPGYADFTGEIKCGLRVCDTAILVLRSAEGVEVGSESSAKLIEQANVPFAVIINKIDNEHSKFEETLQQFRDRINPNTVVVSFPATEGINFDTVVDVVSMKAFTYGPSGSKKVTEGAVPENLKDQAETYRLN
jgi:elongation factor G